MIFRMRHTLNSQQDVHRKVGGGGDLGDHVELQLD